MGSGSGAAPLRVLLVDDEIAYVTVLARRLARRGITAETATSGAAGIQALRDRDFDVAVLDIKMERLDGLEVLRVFRKMLPEMRVIMLSGHGGEAEARAAVHLGAWDYLLKPCDFEELVAKIRKAACPE